MEPATTTTTITEPKAAEPPVLLKNNPMVRRKKWRGFEAPPTLKLSFTLPESVGLVKDLSEYESCVDWLAGLKKVTKSTYSTHVRLLCYFYKTDPDALKTLSGEQLQEMIKKYMLYLKGIAVQRAGKARTGEVSVNSVPIYLNGLWSLVGDEWEKAVNFKKIQKKLDEKIPSPIRGYYIEETAKMVSVADPFDKVLILGEHYSGSRVGGVGPSQFKHLIPIPEVDYKLAFLIIYPNSLIDRYPAVVGPEFLAAVQEANKLRVSWGETITPESFIVRKKYSFRAKRTGVPPQKEPLSDGAMRKRINTLADMVGIDRTYIHPNHSFRHSFETALMNSDVNPEFKKLFMGHSNGLSDIYYDETNPQSRKKIVLEYMKAVDALTITDRHRMVARIDELEKENETNRGLRDQVSELLEWKKKVEGGRPPLGG